MPQPYTNVKKERTKRSVDETWYKNILELCPLDEGYHFILIDIVAPIQEVIVLLHGKGTDAIPVLIALYKDSNTFKRTTKEQDRQMMQKALNRAIRHSSNRETPAVKELGVVVMDGMRLEAFYSADVDEMREMILRHLPISKFVAGVEDIIEDIDLFVAFGHALSNEDQFVEWCKGNATRITIFYPCP